MIWIRKSTRAAALAAVTLFWYVVWTGGRAWFALRGVTNPGWRRTVFRAWARAACGALGVRVQIVGEPPERPALLVSNHLGYLDIPVLAAVTGAVFVSKAEVARWPVVGPLAKTMGTIFLNRERKRDLPAVNEAIGAAHGVGERVVFFPEGTSSPGAELLPFRPSLLAPAADRGLPVHYALLRYDTTELDPPASEAVCWWGDMTFGAHVLGLLGLKRIEARVEFGPEPVVERDRKLLAEKLWHAIHAKFIPTP